MHLSSFVHVSSIFFNAEPLALKDHTPGDKTSPWETATWHRMLEVPVKLVMEWLWFVMVYGWIPHSEDRFASGSLMT